MTPHIPAVAIFVLDRPGKEITWVKNFDLLFKESVENERNGRTGHTSNSGGNADDVM